jgi:hypothetical protein
LIPTNGLYALSGQLCLPLPVIRELRQEMMVDFNNLFRHLIFLQLFGLLLNQVTQTNRFLIFLAELNVKLKIDSEILKKFLSNKNKNN